VTFGNTISPALVLAVVVFAACKDDTTEAVTPTVTEFPRF
jgi:hypothetical protein